MSDEIFCPPNPGTRCTLIMLPQLIGELRDWVIGYRDWFNECGVQDQMPALERLIGKSVDSFQHCAVQDIYQTYWLMRRLRSMWDWTVREYEERWHDKEAQVWRAACIWMGYWVVQMAFMSPEQHELKEQELVMKTKELHRKAQRAFNTLRRSPQKETLSDDEYDRLFNPPGEGE